MSSLSLLISSSWPLIFIGAATLLIPSIVAILLARKISQNKMALLRHKRRLKQISDSYRLNEERNKQIKDCLIEGIIIIDEQSRIIFANSSAKKILKIKPTENISIAAVIREPEFHELISQAKEQAGIVERSVSVTGLERKKLLVRASSMSGGNLMIVVLDETRTSSMDDMHSDFMAHASHELKTPMSVIMANAELLIDSTHMTSSEKLLIQAILRQALRAKKLLDSLLELLRLNSGRNVTSPDFIDIYEIIEDIIASLGRMGSLINNDVPPKTIMWADRLLLERLALIIIENTQKYAGPQAKLYIKAQKIKKSIKLEFSDNGPGIRHHLRERVFERFFRQPEHVRGESDGFGLGLTQARIIANAMGARIWVEETMEPGCTISVLFEEI